jgi:hypothetical protein
MRDRGARSTEDSPCRSCSPLRGQGRRSRVPEATHRCLPDRRRRNDTEPMARATRRAVKFEPYAKGRFAADEDEAKASRAGLWKGCFAIPQDLRRWNKSTAKLLGASCSMIRDIDARNALFPDDPGMPPDCSIKGKFAVRAKLTGHRGIYHLESCGSYQRTKKPDRWFCSEEDAQAAGFRKALTCRS